MCCVGTFPSDRCMSPPSRACHAAQRTCVIKVRFGTTIPRLVYTRDTCTSYTKDEASRSTYAMSATTNSLITQHVLEPPQQLRVGGEGGRQTPPMLLHRVEAGEVGSQHRLERGVLRCARNVTWIQSDFLAGLSAWLKRRQRATYRPAHPQTVTRLPWLRMPSRHTAAELALLWATDSRSIRCHVCSDTGHPRCANSWAKCSNWKTIAHMTDEARAQYSLGGPTPMCTNITRSSPNLRLLYPMPRLTCMPLVLRSDCIITLHASASGKRGTCSTQRSNSS